MCLFFQSSSGIIDTEFLSSSLLSCLGDDDPTVVRAVLSIHTQDLLRVLPVHTLFPSLLSLVSPHRLHKSPMAIQDNALTALNKLFSVTLLETDNLQGVNDVIATTIPLLFTGRHSNVLAGKVAEVIVQSPISDEHKVFQGLKEVFDTKGEICEFFFII